MTNVTLQFSQITVEDLGKFIEEKVTEAVQKIVYSKNKDEKEILSRQETADLLGTSLTTLFHWANLGVLNPTKIGRRVYYTQSELQRYFANVKPLNQ